MPWQFSALIHSHGGGATFVDAITFVNMLVEMKPFPLTKAFCSSTAQKLQSHSDRLANMAEAHALVGAVDLVIVAGNTTSAPCAHLQSSLPPSPRRLPHIFVLRTQTSSHSAIVHTNAESAFDISVYA